MKKFNIILTFSMLLLSFNILAEPLSAAKKEMINELMVFTGNAKRAEERALNGAYEFANIIRQSSPDFPPTLLEIVVEEMNNKIHSELDSGNPIRDIVTEIYHENFSSAEIKELLRFYQTPVGKKITSLASSMREETASEINLWWQSLMPEIMEKSEARFKAEGMKQ